MSATKRLVLRVPLLAEQPVIGAGCCAILAEDIVRDELERLDGVYEVLFDAAVGLVEVYYEPERLEAEKIVKTLDSTGYPAADPSEAGGQAPRQAAPGAPPFHASGETFYRGSTT